MNYEKYYVQKSDGSYLIHFPNRNGLSDDKLMEMLSIFGRVLSITNNGRPCGLCYVRYQTLTEVKRCIDGASSSGIKILPHKQKMNQKNVNMPNTNRRTDASMNTEVLSTKNKIQVSNEAKDPSNSNVAQIPEYSCASIDNSGENDCYPYQVNVAVHSQNNTSTNTTALSVRHSFDDTLEDHIKVSNSSKDLPNLGLTQILSRSSANTNRNDENDYYSHERRTNSLNSIKNAPMNTTTLSEKDPLADTLENQSMASNKCKDASDCNAVLPIFRKYANITKSTSSILDPEKSEEDSKLDSNVGNEHLEYASPSKNILPDNVTHTFPMAEVIVANIHPDLCVHNVLHILKKYDPLYISTIKKTPVKGIRYCHIYYTDVGDAAATVNEFDMSDVCGKSLIVFMPHTSVDKTC